MEEIKAYLKEKKPFIDSKIEKYIPREYTQESLDFSLGPARYSYDLEAPNEALAKVIWEFLDRGGKRWRPAMFLLLADALGGDVDELGDFVLVPEVVHNGTLLVDDIEDRGELRRGKPCSHLVFGVDVAVNAGNAMYFLPILAFMKNRGRFPAETMLDAYEIYSQEMVNLHFGQAMDIWWHGGKGSSDLIAENEYLQMCAYKTGTLARMSAKLAGVFAGASKEVIESLGKFAESVGVAFQIQDDLLDISLKESERGEFGKTFGNDIKEGKRTLMIIHTLKNASQEDRKRLIEILRAHTSDKDLFCEALALLEKYGSAGYAREKAKSLVKESWAEVEKVLEPGEAKEKLQSFVEFLINRKI
ncbi:MAG: polyprenyl synthetase family protein [Candidatus Diapherotrites archaeon]|nr:polyprenyl synthetase family protein [Candidatus Diapherotrites archaeon]